MRKEKDIIELMPTGIPLARNGATEYCIIVPENGEREAFAASELALFFGKATGAELKTVNDTDAVWYEGTKYISIGRNRLAESAGVSPNADLGRSGFNITTRGDSVFLLGQTGDAALYAVYGFMRYTFGFEAYAADECAYTKSESLNLIKMSVRKKPAFDLRLPGSSMVSSNPVYAARLRMKTGQTFMRVDPDNWQNLATTLLFIPKSEFWETRRDYYNQLGDDVNFANKEMLAVALERMKEAVRRNPDTEFIMFGQQDGASWDTGSVSREIIWEYGANAATAVLAGNYFARGLREWLAAEQPGRRVKVGIFAYLFTMPPPAVADGRGGYRPAGDAMLCDEDLFVFLAPMGTDYKYAYDDPNNYAPVNAIRAEAVKGWSALTDNLLIWGYQTNFRNLLTHFNSYETMQGLYQFYEKYGGFGLFDQGQTGGNRGGTAFSELKQYLSSKLMWDTGADFEALAAAFIDNFYGAAAAPMKEYYASVREHIKDMDGRIYFDLLDAELWPKAKAGEWARLFDRAYRLIEPTRETDKERYETLRNRLDKERLAVLYILIELYPDYF
ncbi:MAG: DUF4838 domain-containing protein, partial [Clostridiales bacterium]|nr:DUF4838 domain-containing protein [Clostridiales bacterium]